MSKEADNAHRKQQNTTVEEDAFWEIALSENRQEFHDIDTSDNVIDGPHEEEDTGHTRGGKKSRYHLPTTSITLELASFAPEDGIWSPVGADAWYSSALLTSLIFMVMTTTATATKTKPTTPPNNCNSNDDIDSHRQYFQNIIPRVFVDEDEMLMEKNIRVLELGSGAKGLAGFSFAAALSLQPDRFPAWTVTMTDNDEAVLKQLNANVRNNSSKLIVPGSDTSSTSGKMINVEYLDWGRDFSDEDNFNSDSGTKDFESDGRSSLLTADIAIGSELAYTHETATALVKLILTLLKKNDGIHIWIVQVTDRYGWSEIVIPALETNEDNKIEIQPIPLSWDIHEMACTLIPMGGALDRHAFGAFCIKNAPI